MSNPFDSLLRQLEELGDTLSKVTSIIKEITPSDADIQDTLSKLKVLNAQLSSATVQTINCNMISFLLVNITNAALEQEQAKKVES